MSLSIIDRVTRFEKYAFADNSRAKVNPVEELSLIFSFNSEENILKAFVQSLKGILAI